MGMTVRDVHAEEFAALGQLLVEVYSKLPALGILAISPRSPRPGCWLHCCPLAGLPGVWSISGICLTTVPLVRQQSSRHPAFAFSGFIRSAATLESARHSPLHALHWPVNTAIQRQFCTPRWQCKPPGACTSVSALSGRPTWTSNNKNCRCSVSGSRSGDT